MLERLGLLALHRLDPERAHGLALSALRMGFGPSTGPFTSQRLATSLAGLPLRNPIGLAAGFDKNATAVAPLMRAGFGFLEVGAATPRPQPGNPKPRMFRLSEDRAVINRFGFNNDGMQAIDARLSAVSRDIPVGLNLGANKDSEDRAADFAAVLTQCGPHVDFATINVSSPNTERLRDLQGKEALAALLETVTAARTANGLTLPLFLKIAPDLSEAEIADVVAVVRSTSINGIIATNTTLARDGLASSHAPEKGGLSGAPVFERSTRVLARLSALTEGQIPLIGVGGVSSAEQAYAKILAGASAVQLYTALGYAGLALVDEITRGLDHLLERDGFATVADAVGKGRDAWL